MAKTHHTNLDEIIAHFTDLEDPRSPLNRKHPLVSVVVIALMAVLAGAGGPTAIARWAKTKHDFLLRVLDLPAGIPGKDVFRRVLMLLHPAALHAVSVWASEFGLSLGQIAGAEKSNEITAIPELLRLVDIRGAIITIDAMGTQKAIAEQIIEQKADYVLALKGNQEKLHQAVIGHIDRQLENDFAGSDMR